MSYAIMRMTKIKSRVSLAGTLKHNYREKVPANANPAKENLTDGKTSAEVLRDYTAKLPTKVRKNAVHAVEFVITTSAEFYQNGSTEKIGDYYQGAINWVRNLFGKENVLSHTLHGDEKTPHIHIVAMPLVDGKLNARALIGGSNQRARELQDSFYEAVGKPVGLERGVAKKAVRHTEPKEFARVMKEKQAAIEKQIKAIDARERTLNEREGIVLTKETVVEKSIESLRNLPDGKLAYSIQSRLRGLNNDEINQCWEAMESKANELRNARYSKIEQSKPRGRSR